MVGGGGGGPLLAGGCAGPREWQGARSLWSLSPTTKRCQHVDSTFIGSWGVLVSSPSVCGLIAGWSGQGWIFRLPPWAAASEAWVVVHRRVWLQACEGRRRAQAGLSRPERGRGGTHGRPWACLPCRGAGARGCTGLESWDQCPHGRENKTAPACPVGRVPSARFKDRTDRPRAGRRGRPGRFQRTGTLLGRLALVPVPGPGALPRTQGLGTRRGLSRRLFLASCLRLQGFAERRSRLLPGLRGGADFLHAGRSVRYFAVGPVFCGVLRSAAPGCRGL